MAGEAVKGRSSFGNAVQFPRKEVAVRGCSNACNDVTRLPGYNDIIQLCCIMLLSFSFSFSHTLSLSLSQHLITVLLMSAMCAPIPSESSFGVGHEDFIFQYARSALSLLSGKYSLPRSAYWSDGATYRTPRFHIGCF